MREVVVEVVEVARVREARRMLRGDIFFGWMMDDGLFACLFEENRLNQGPRKE